MEKTKIKPALTADEWEEVLGVPGIQFDQINEPHRVAALALYDQPFGFTRDDVRALRGELHPDGWPGIRRIADRIEALVPPVRRCKECGKLHEDF